MVFDAVGGIHRSGVFLLLIVDVCNCVCVCVVV